MITARTISDEMQLATLTESWNVLSDRNPLRSWDWLATWWKHYGQLGDRELFVVAVQDDDELIGIAPWYIDRSLGKGTAIRQLGDGEVCTDHVSLIAFPENVDRVAKAVADLLVENDDWDRLELEATDEGDPSIERLAHELRDRDCLVSRHGSANCWVIDLPRTWDEYLATLSQSHRRQLKKCRASAIDSGRSRLHSVRNRDELDEAWPVLVELHQRRRNSLGEPGCFASPNFHDFHREVAERLLAAGQLRMSWTEFDGAPFTAEYHVASPSTVYTYQSGMDTNRLQDSPGRLAYVLTIERAIGAGLRHVDFMRGDEPYKAHFRATARPQHDYRVFPNRPLARWRGQIELAGRSLKHWIKQGVATVRQSAGERS